MKHRMTKNLNANGTEGMQARRAKQTVNTSPMQYKKTRRQNTQVVTELLIHMQNAKTEKSYGATEFQGRGQVHAENATQAD